MDFATAFRRFEILIFGLSMVVSFRFPKIPPTIFEADTRTRTGTYSQKEMMDQVRWDVLCFPVLGSITFI